MGGAAVAAVITALSLVVGCGQGQDADRPAAIASFMDANPEASEAQAGCVVDRLVERYGFDGLAAELEAIESQVIESQGTESQGTESSGTESEAPGLDPEFIEHQFRDRLACGMEGDIRAQIVQQLEADDVAAEDAPCVAEQLVENLGDGDIDVLLSGESTDDFLAKFIAAMEFCGAINS